MHCLPSVLHEYIFREVNQTNLTAIANELILYMLMLLAPVFIISVVLAISGQLCADRFSRFR